MLQLQLSSTADVAGEQPYDRPFGHREKLIKKPLYSRKHGSREFNKVLAQDARIDLEKPAEIFVVCFDPVELEAFAHQGNIGSPGKLKSFCRLQKVECFSKRLFERFYSGSTRADQRAVDIKKN